MAEILFIHLEHCIIGLIRVCVCVCACVPAHGSARLALFVTSPEQTNTPVRKWVTVTLTPCSSFPWISITGEYFWIRLQQSFRVACHRGGAYGWKRCVVEWSIFSTPPKSSRARIDKKTARAARNTHYRYNQNGPLDHKMTDNCVSLARTNTISSTITKPIKTWKTSNKSYSYSLLNCINKMYTQWLILFTTRVGSVACACL